jgi:hypothetical protein
MNVAPRIRTSNIAIAGINCRAVTDKTAVQDSSANAPTDAGAACAGPRANLARSAMKKSLSGTTGSLLAAILSAV